MLAAEIYVKLKKTVADPQGLTVKHALESLGYANINEARMGKLISITLDTDNKQEAEKQLTEMCQKLLANPIIEDFHFVIKQ